MSSWELQLGNTILKIMGNPSQNAAAVQSDSFGRSPSGKEREGVPLVAVTAQYCVVWSCRFHPAGCVICFFCNASYTEKSEG